MGSSDVASQWSGQRFWRSILTISLVLALVVLVVEIGAAVTGLGVASAAGALILPLAGPYLVLAAVPAAILGLVGLRRLPRLLAAATAGFGLAATATGLVMVLTFIAAVGGNGGTVNVLRALDLGSPVAATADAYEVYRIAEGEELSMAVFRPDDDQASWPTLVILHGGGWNSGSNSSATADDRWYADQGWLVLNVEYRLATETSPTWAQAPQDVACALAWTARNAERLGVDVDRLVVAGESAGGNLALNLAYGAATGQATPNCSGEVPVPAGVVASYPVVDPAAAYRADTHLGTVSSRAFTSEYVGGAPSQYPNRYIAISSSTYISPEAPPTLLIEPNHDSLIAPSTVTGFAAAAASAGVDVTVAGIPFANHAFDFGATGSMGNQARRTLTAHFLERFEN